MRTVNFQLLVVIFCFAFLTSSIYAQDSALKETFQKMNNEMIETMLMSRL
jgi:hypothetical protein